MLSFELLIAGLSGLILGALLNVIVIRLPHERLSGGVPRCTRCNAQLAWWQLLPVIGWLIQGGRGKCCGRRLHWIFPVCEILVAAAVAVFFSRYGLSAVFGYLVFVTAVLVVSGAIDWLHRSVYTMVVLGAALLAVICSPFVAGHSLVNALLGALIGGIVFTIFFALARVLYPARAVPFGLGDVYLAVFIGSAVGIIRLSPALFIGMLLAGIFAALIMALKRYMKRAPVYISYGTFMCIGALWYLVFYGW
jgi:leader peptidase (prepilin peptidase)/N-methyltransferase